jgi:hypothetical protein
MRVGDEIGLRLQASFFKLQNNYLHCDWTRIRVKLVNKAYLFELLSIFINFSVNSV